MKPFKDELLKNDSDFFDKYEEKRQEGENDSYICSQIRRDSVEEFISYLNRNQISHSSLINPSIFETNLFLNEQKEITLIEYSAFFGSIQIFRYLLMNNVKLTPSLWFYSIHSNNAELIHILEYNNVPPPLEITNKNQRENQNDTLSVFRIRKKITKKDMSKETFNYAQCFIESLKCHHNNIAEYIENNLMVLNKQVSEKQKDEIIISNCIKYHNYAYFQVDTINDYGFFYLYLYHYDKLVEYLLKKKEQEIEMKII